MAKYVYLFEEGNAKMRDLLGGKGANLCEMTRVGLPVPPGFVITTEACNHYSSKGEFPPGLKTQVEKALSRMEKEMGGKLGDPTHPLLLSCRSGARASMPGMMETILNIGLTTRTIPRMIALTKNPRFVWDAYRRLLMMYADVVMEKAAGIEAADGHGIRQQLEDLMEEMKKKVGAKLDTDLGAENLQELCTLFRDKIKKVLHKPFPDDAIAQLWGGVAAVFRSWNGKRAASYRRIEGIPDDWGTATNVQAMVFGNMGDTSATGVAFTRNPATGEDVFYGEWLPNAQGEDVVAGIRTPNPLNEATRSEHSENRPSLERFMPKVYRQLFQVRNKLERHYRDMQDIEFTIQEGRLWILQTRTGKRNGVAALRMAMQDHKRGWINENERTLRVSPDQLDELLHPMLDPKEEIRHFAVAKGLPAGPGGAVGRVVFTADDAVSWNNRKEKVVLVREETNPEDIEGMRAAQAILTARGGMTSHAALVARGWGKCCIVGAASMEVDSSAKATRIGDIRINEGDWISLNGTTGKVYQGQMPLVESEIVQVTTRKLVPSKSKMFKLYTEFMRSADEVRRLGVRANADNPEAAIQALQFQAEGIGLFRTEHMFYDKGGDEPLFYLRKMILTEDLAERKSALDELYPYVKAYVKSTLETMTGKPVTIRLLDPPLHEFVPNRQDERTKLAESLGITMDQLEERARNLHESNPMMGHRGVRLGITYPEVSEMQVRAILEATAELMKEGKKPMPEIMIPVVCEAKEIQHQAALVRRVHDEVAAKHRMKRIPHVVGTMIEIPRAAILAGEIAKVTEFFSFGTNDLTQMTFGFSRDDIGTFVPDYIDARILPNDPFNKLDQKGVGQLIEMGIQRGRASKPKLKVGICGEHGGDPSSVEFCHAVGMDYVSCSPFRVPIARLAAAHASLKGKATADRGV